MSDIDRTVPVPIYYQLKLLIQRQIERGELRPGDKLPTEQELCERHGISRTPVRQALLELAREGILTRTAGRGTFVAAGGASSTRLRVTIPDARWRWPLEEAARGWRSAHPDHPIELDFEEAPLSELHDHLALAVAHGKAPDISLLDSVWVAEFAHRRYLSPLSELDPRWYAEVQDSFYPSLLAPNRYQDELYAVPTNADATVLWFRTDWFEAEDLAPPENWEDLIRIGRHFRQPEVRRRYGLGPHPLIFLGGRVGGETTTYQLLPFIWSAGGDLISRGEVVLESDRTKEALTFLMDLVQSEQLAPPDVVELPWDGAMKAFARGQVAMGLGGTYENFLIQAVAGWDSSTFLERVGFVPLPGGPKGGSATLVGGMSYGIYRQSESARQALKILKLALSPNVLKPFSLRTGQNPAIIPIATAILPEEDGFLGRTGPLIAKARGRPSLPDYDRVSMQFQEMVEMCLTGQLTVSRAVERAADRISGIIGLPVA